MALILYGILVAHLISYKEYYIKIGITFSAAFITKRLIKVMGSKEQAEIIGLAGYALTFGDVVKLLQAMKNNAMRLPPGQEQEIVGGILGKGLDMLKEIIENKK